MPLSPKLNKFSTTPPQVVSYSYSDIDSNTGINVFYLSTSYNTSLSYNLTKEIVYSDEIDLPRVGTNIVDYTKKIDIDFDLSVFNEPKTLRGTATANIGGYCVGDTGDTDAYYVVRIRKWDGSSETEITMGTGKVFKPITGDPNTKIHNINIEVPETHFAEGETLRVTIEGWIRQTSGGVAYMSLGFDPKNRDGNWILPTTDDPTSTTASVINIPYKLRN